MYMLHVIFFSVSFLTIKEDIQFIWSLDVSSSYSATVTNIKL